MANDSNHLKSDAQSIPSIVGQHRDSSSSIHSHGAETTPLCDDSSEKQQAGIELTVVDDSNTPSSNINVNICNNTNTNTNNKRKKDNKSSQNGSDIDSSSSPVDAQSKEAKKLKRMVILKIILRIIVVSILITVAIQLKINVSDTMSDILQTIHNEFGNIYISALIYCILASLFTSVSPMGYLPTLLAGVLYPFYIAPFIAYISVNIGSWLNILLIRKVILGINCTKKCFSSICGRKLGRVSYLENILKTHDSNIIIKIVLLARLPYLSNGTFNYLFGLSSIKIIDYIKGNAIGFIPGSILFSTLGLEMKSLVKMIDEGPDSAGQLILFICVCIVAIVCYIVIVYKARLLLREQSKIVKARSNSNISNSNSKRDNGGAGGESINNDDDEDEDEDEDKDLKLCGGKGRGKEEKIKKKQYVQRVQSRETEFVD